MWHGGGRTWWAHFGLTPINIEPIILSHQFEDVREAGAPIEGSALGSSVRA
jgi:hypothetical protein